MWLFGVVKSLKIRLSLRWRSLYEKVQKVAKKQSTRGTINVVHSLQS